MSSTTEIFTSVNGGQPHRLPGLIGLQNLGNTCYLNAIIQALSNCIQLREHLLVCPLFMESEEDSFVSLELREVLEKLWSTKNLSEVSTSINCSKLLSSLSKKHPQFYGFYQHDGQELLRCLLTQLHEELKFSVITSIPESPGQSSPNKRRKITQYSSIITDIFEGKLVNSIECSTCHKVSSVTETFEDISLALPECDPILLSSELKPEDEPKTLITDDTISSAVSSSQVNELTYNKSGLINRVVEWVKSWYNYEDCTTLQDCLEQFFSEDVLTEDNMYHCAHCNRLRQGVKSESLHHLPEVLCLHLKRFGQRIPSPPSIVSQYKDNQTQVEPTTTPEPVIIKLSSPIIFPLSGLDMRKYRTPEVTEQQEDSDGLYDLVTMVCHRGSEDSSGHYVTYALHSGTDSWFEFNDEVVTKVENIDKILHRLYSEAYVLFYQKRDAYNMLNVGYDVQRLLNQDKQRQFAAKFYVSKTWLIRLSSFSHPGPIRHNNLLCPHGVIWRYPGVTAAELVEPVAIRVWKYLLDKFGGGPQITSLKTCCICSRALKNEPAGSNTSLQKDMLNPATPGSSSETSSGSGNKDLEEGPCSTASLSTKPSRGFSSTSKSAIQQSLERGDAPYYHTRKRSSSALLVEKHVTF